MPESKPSADDPPRATGGDTVVYVELLDEAVEVYRPTLAARERDGYRLPAESPKGEVWAVPPGALARCERDTDGALHAVAVL